RAIDAAERRVRDEVPSATYIYLEPDLDRLLSSLKKKDEPND
ncbi:MAG: hypothetical protein ACJAY5_002013, partial [Actinomycetes bacterium]